jgi:transposase
VAGGHLAGHKSAAADLGTWLCWEDESGQGLRPPRGRTWGRRGRTPAVTVTGGHDTRVSLATLIAVRPGCGPRLIFRTHRARRADKRKGFTEADYARFLDAAHQQLGGPVVVVWDGLNTHTSHAMRELIAARPWLTVFQLPAYAPELNPAGPVWPDLKRSLANLTKHDIDQLTALVKTRIRRMQCRPGLLQGFLAKPGLDLAPLQ